MACCSGSAALSCCPETQYVQDKVCAPWNGTVDGAAVDLTLFNSNMGSNLYGTGYLKYDTGPAPITVTVNDSLGNALSASTLDPGTVVTFTYRRLGSVEVALPATDGEYQGEFCLTVRYQVQ